MAEKAEHRKYSQIGSIFLRVVYSSIHENSYLFREVYVHSLNNMASPSESIHGNLDNGSVSHRNRVDKMVS